MSTWISDRDPETNGNVLVSLSFDEDVRIGFYVERKESWGALTREWWVWEGENLERYGPSYVDGWMPLPKAMYDSAAAFAEAMAVPTEKMNGKG